MNEKCKSLNTHIHKYQNNLILNKTKLKKLSININNKVTMKVYITTPIYFMIK